MTGKDWILLLVPILVNCLVVYLFARQIMSKIEATGQQRVTYATLSELRVMVQSALSKCTSMLSQKQNVFEDDVDELAGLVHRIADWIDIHTETLGSCRPILKNVIMPVLTLDEQCAEAQAGDGIYRDGQAETLKVTISSIQEALKILYKRCQELEQQ